MAMALLLRRLFLHPPLPPFSNEETYERQLIHDIMDQAGAVHTYALDVNKAS
jgi:hypothetical protein